jgi:ABC-type Zn uptake system ZnuABC Zn-binding protein ZnuA
MGVARWCLAVVLVLAAVSSGCGSSSGTPGGEESQVVVLADTSYLADIAQNVAGARLSVSSLLPVGADPHSFEPTPRDAKRIAESRAVIINSAGFEPAVEELIASAGSPDLLVIEAAAGLTGRVPQAGDTAAGSDDDAQAQGRGQIDPHFWLDPLKVIAYVENIERGFSALDPSGADVYKLNAEKYTQRLRELDGWIVAQVESIPAERRLLVTNHESFGYFADRYGFTIVGTIFPTMGAEGTPSAQQLAALVEEIRATGAPAIFLETGSNADLASQVARETGVKVVTELYTHSLGEKASTYVDMMRWNVGLIVEALR